MVMQKVNAPVNIPDERMEEMKARILEACREPNGRINLRMVTMFLAAVEACRERDGQTTNLRALNVFLAAVEEVGPGAGQEIVELMVATDLRGFEWWLLFEVGCSKNAKLFVSIIRLGTAREMLAMIPVSMDTEPGD